MISCGFKRERTRDADALALATGELVREPVRVLGRQADDAQQLVHALLAPGRRRTATVDRAAAR